MKPELTDTLERPKDRKGTPSRMNPVNPPSPDIDESKMLEGNSAKQSCAPGGWGPDVDLTTATSVAASRSTASVQSTNDNAEDYDSKSRKKSKTRRRLGMASRPRKPKDMPRRPLSAYNIFFKSERAKMIQSSMASVSSGESPAGKLGFDLLAKTIGKRWKSISESDLAICKAESDKDMRRYKSEMQEYHMNLAKMRRGGGKSAADQEEDHSPPPSQTRNTLANLHSVPAPTYSSDLHEELHNSPPGGSSLVRGRLTGMSSFALDSERRAAGLVHELENIRKQALLMQQGIPSLPSTGGAGSFLYDQLLASELLRRQEALAEAGDFRWAADVGPSYGSVQSLLARSHLQSVAASAAAPAYGNALALLGRSQLQSLPSSSLPWDREYILRRHIQDLPSLAPPALIGGVARPPAPYFGSSVYESMSALEAQQRIIDAYRAAGQDSSPADDNASSK